MVNGLHLCRAFLVLSVTQVLHNTRPLTFIHWWNWSNYHSFPHLHIDGTDTGSNLGFSILPKESRDRTTNLPVSGEPTLTPEPHLLTMMVYYLSQKRLKQVPGPSSVWAVFYCGGTRSTA